MVKTAAAARPPVWSPWFRTRYDLRDKVVLVTGAASGIGAATAALLIDRGARVALLDIDARAVEIEANVLGDKAIGFTVDVRDRAAMDAVMRQVVARFGRIDAVVANAGVAPVPSTLRTVGPVEFDRVLDINLVGVFNTVRPALEQVIAHHGHVVIVASAAAFVPGAGLASYMVSKSGVEALGRALRIELAAVGASAGIAYFGFVKTPLAAPMDEDPLGRQLDRLMPWPLNRRISAEDAAKTIVDGIVQRSGATFAPMGWREYSLARGAANAVIDAVAAGSGLLHVMLREIESRSPAVTLPTRTAAD